MGSGVLTTVEFDNITGNITLIDESSIILSYPGGDNQYFAEVQGDDIMHDVDCAGIYYNEVEILIGCDGVCGSGHILDCEGTCLTPSEILNGEGVFIDCNGMLL